MNDRHELERVDPGPVPTPANPGPAQAPTFLLSRRVFLTGVAGVYALAFAQLLEQVQGLFGARGIAPVATSLQAFGEQVHGFARLQLPTLLWFGASDGAMLTLCRSEERRVGKECRSRWWRYHLKTSSTGKTQHDR